MIDRSSLDALLFTSLDTRHGGESCRCWRCVAHRLVLDGQLSRGTDNERYQQHLNAVRRRARYRSRYVGKCAMREHV